MNVKTSANDVDFVIILIIFTNPHQYLRIFICMPVLINRLYPGCVARACPLLFRLTSEVLFAG